MHGFSNYFRCSPVEATAVVTNTFLSAPPVRAAPGNSLQGISQQTPTSALAQCGSRHSSAIQCSIMSDSSDLSLYARGCLRSKSSITQGCCCCRPWELPGSGMGQHGAIQPLMKPLSLQDYLTHDQGHPDACTHAHCFQSQSCLQW